MVRKNEFLKQAAFQKTKLAITYLLAFAIKYYLINMHIN